MLTLNMMRGIRLTPVPWGQIFTATTFLTPLYNMPGRRVKISVEGYENIPKSGRVILALNHTDRFNYWPLQYYMWRQRERMFTATWVKGKYFNSPVTARFMLSTNNIPTPSRGYLITTDVVNVVGEPPDEAVYRILRDGLDATTRELAQVRSRAAEAGVLSTIEAILTTPRDMLGHTFRPGKETYFQAMDQLFAQMMGAFISLNEQAFELGHKIIVFPEGTRSLRLAPGRPGLAQMALKMKATVVPIGCNGSDEVYPGNSPVPLPGHVSYRIGEPLTPEGALREFQLDQDFVPFTKSAERAHGEVFQAMTELLMERIAELVDERYLPSAGETTEVTGANRFL